MNDKLTIEARGLGIEYYNHKIFELLADLNDFYDFLSDSCCNMADGCLITGKFSVNSNIYSSIQGTIESIKILVFAGRLNDAFALTRKFEDAIYADLYTNILLQQDEHKIVNPKESVKKIWDESIVRKWVLDGYILWGKKKKGETLLTIERKIKEVDPELGILFEDTKKKSDNRQVCNDNVHYNSWETFAINDFHYLSGTRKGIELLNDLYDIILRFFVYHFSYTYIQRGIIYGSYDYINDLEEGLEPEPDSQYWIASIVQDLFDKYIKTEYNTIAQYLINKEIMNLK